MYATLITFFQAMHASHSVAMYLALFVVLLIIAGLTLLVNWVLKNFIFRYVNKLAGMSSRTILPMFNKRGVFNRLSQLGAAIFLSFMVKLVRYEPLSFTSELASVLHTLALVYALVMIVLTFARVLDAVHDYSNKLEYLQNKPIRSYLQVIKIIGWLIAVVLAISLLLDKSPMVFLTGLGAISAVTMLVFKDTILGFVASIQVAAYDAVRVGDWITIAGKNVDGTVMDVAVNTVKIRNFDNTIITIPTYDLVNNSVQNWRGMTESGGRRIKRSILIDLDTVKFCDEKLLKKLSRLHYLTGYLENRSKEINEYNDRLKVDKSLQANGRDLTNIGLFRAYIESYLMDHNKIHKGMTFLIRQLQPKETGLPLEIYVFTNDTNWVNYEGIQADIFDHLLATLPFFELRAFQYSRMPIV